MLKRILPDLIPTTADVQNLAFWVVTVVVCAVALAGIFWMVEYFRTIGESRLTSEPQRPTYRQMLGFGCGCTPDTYCPRHQALADELTERRQLLDASARVGDRSPRQLVVLNGGRS